MKYDRIGRFSVSFSFLDRIKDGDEGLNLFQGLFILEARSNYCASRIDYIAAGNQFDQVPESGEIPEYDATFTSGSTKPQWVRRS